MRDISDFLLTNHPVSFILCLVLEKRRERGCSSMVEYQPSKLDTWVRFPSPALCDSGVVVTRDLAKVETAGSSPVYRSLNNKQP